MAYPYIVQADLENRLSAETVRQIYDDDNNGTADPGPIERLLADASSKVASYLRGIYDLTIVAANPPNEVKRLTLDVAVAYAAQRHGEYVRRDWEKLMKAAESDLMKLREGKTRLDVVGSPEPAANTGGTVSSTTIDPVTNLPGRVFDDMGDF